MNKSEIREIRIVVHEGIDELGLMRDLSCLIDGPIYLDQFPHLMDGTNSHSYRLDSHNDWFACLGRKGESLLSTEPPLEYDMLRIWHRYGGKPLESIKPWLEYRFSPFNPEGQSEEGKQFTLAELEKMLSDHLDQCGKIRDQNGNALRQNTINIAKQLLSILGTEAIVEVKPDYATAEELVTMIADYESFWSDRFGRGDIDAENADVLPGKIVWITSQLIEALKL